MVVVCTSRLFKCLSGSFDRGSISLEALFCSLFSLAHAVLPIELHAISQSLGVVEKSQRTLGLLRQLLDVFSSGAGLPVCMKVCKRVCLHARENLDLRSELSQGTCNVELFLHVHFREQGRVRYLPQFFGAH